VKGSHYSEAAGAAGRVQLRGEEEFLSRVRPLCDLACRRGEKERGLFEYGAWRSHFKMGPLRGKSSLRHAARSLWPGLDIPCLQEFDNLAWLRRNGFHAPRPLAAGGYRNALGLPTFQFLYTELVPDAPTLREVFESGPAELRHPALIELGLELARLHQRGFVHRDLFPRNLLVSGAGDAVQIHFLDAWRGGPPPGLRPPAFDLACLMLFGADLFESDEQLAFFESYFDEGERLGRTSRRERVLRSTARRRERLRRRFLARRIPGNPLGEPSADWSPPSKR
jgi:tRNA A-37 threonylcarbamoyl transferase component Bud32